MMQNSMTMTHHPLVMMKAANSLSVVKSSGNRSSQFTRLMTMTSAAPYPTGTTDHHLRIRGKPNPKKFTAVAAAAAKAKTTTTTTTTKGRKSETLGPGLGDPCLDLFFGVQENSPKFEKYRLLKQLLPAAWSHNPLTTLKLICNLRDLATEFGKYDHESFYRAVVWLHHKHPKTLASNVLPIFCKHHSSLGDLHDLAEILNRLAKSWTWISELEDYRLLHDRVSNILAGHLKRNVQNMNEQKHLSHYDCLLNMDSSADRAILLLYGESIAKKLFRRESYPEYQGLKESLYVDTVRDRLRNEVLAPLIEYKPPPSRDSKFGIKNSYLAESVKAAAAGSLLPHEIISFANDFDRHVAQLYWERMVEDVYLKEEKFKNCLVVCNTTVGWASGCLHDNVALSLAVLVSQLSGGPWKGKVISSGPNPKLHNLPGSDLDLLSNCTFLKRMDYGLTVDIPKVFDLILQEAVNANLPPEQMIKKVFLVTLDGLAVDSWESDYKAILTKYKEKGYGQDAVPQIVLWNVHHVRRIVEAPRSRPGLATLAGFSRNLFKSFLDNGGQFGPHHVVEAAISGQQYQDLVVID